jgi:hypothetical protein
MRCWVYSVVNEQKTDFGLHNLYLNKSPTMRRLSRR